MNPSLDPQPEPLPISVAGRTHDPIIPACPVCGSITERLTTTERRCSFGHVSRLSFGEHPNMINGIISESWTMRAVAVLVLMVGGFAQASEEVPYATLRAIVYVESHGILLRDGRVVGAVHQDGAAREVGVAQLAPVVCRQWGFDRAALRSDDRYCLACARLHLLWLRRHTRSWDEAVRAYNAGLTGRNRPSAFLYADRVKHAEGN